MNDVQAVLTELKNTQWTQAEIADELGVSVSAIQKWKAGTLTPAKPGRVLVVLNSLKEKRPPRTRHYPGGHHLQRRKWDEN